MSPAKCGRYCDGKHYRVGQVLDARGGVVLAIDLLDETHEMEFDAGEGLELKEGQRTHVQLIRCNECNPEPVTDPALQKPAGKSARLKLHSTEEPEPEPEQHARLPYPDN